MMILPVAFVPVLVKFPVGLVLYWVTTNLWTVGQGVVTRRLVPKKDVAPAKRSSRTAPKSAPPEEDGTAAKSDSPAPSAPPAAPKRVKRKKKARR
jgi:YidC/Oxa1 family membrane protein insertase